MDSVAARPRFGIQQRRRIKAFSIHLSLSAIAFLFVLYIMLRHWYPAPHFSVNGGWQGVRIMLFVDFVIGPFLTLLLFSPRKSIRALVFDMICIAICQISAFSWGVYAVHSQHPVGLSLSYGVVYPILRADLDPQKKTPADLQELDDGHPPVVYARPPANDGELAGVQMHELLEGITEARVFYLLMPIKNNIEKVFAASLEQREDAPESFTAIREQYLNRHGLHGDEVAFVPFAGKYGTALMVFDRAGKIIDTIADPRISKELNQEHPSPAHGGRIPSALRINLFLYLFPERFHSLTRL